jgi:hypothetical protein
MFAPIKLPKVPNHQFRKDSDLSRGVMPRRSDNEEPDFAQRIVIHQRYQSAGRELFLHQESGSAATPSPATVAAAPASSVSLVVARPIEVAGVKQIESSVERSPNCRDPLGPIFGRDWP